MKKGDFEVKYNDDQLLTPLPTDENSKTHPISLYGITKHTQEQMIMTLCAAIGIPAVSLRYQNVYGEGQSLLNPYTGILSIFSAQILNGNDINIFEDGKESRDFIHISDVIDATIKAIEKTEANNHIFNVGTGINTDIITVANELIRNYNRTTNAETSGLFRIGDIRHNFADITKIKNLLSFHPKVNFKEGIQKFTQWVIKQSIKDVKFKESIEEMKKKGLLK